MDFISFDFFFICDPNKNRCGTKKNKKFSVSFEYIELFCK